MLSCSQTHASARSVSPVAFINDAGLRCFGFIKLESTTIYLKYTQHYLLSRHNISKKGPITDANRKLQTIR